MPKMPAMGGGNTSGRKSARDNPSTAVGAGDPSTPASQAEGDGAQAQQTTEIATRYPGYRHTP